jgi:hypothetical protein
VSDSQQPDEVSKRQKIQQQLDEALADSFPASDPVSIVTSNEEEDWGDAPDSAKAPSGVESAHKNPPP